MWKIPRCWWTPKQLGIQDVGQRGPKPEHREFLFGTRKALIRDHTNLGFSSNVHVLGLGFWKKWIHREECPKNLWLRGFGTTMKFGKVSTFNCAQKIPWQRIPKCHSSPGAWQTIPQRSTTLLFMTSFLAIGTWTSRKRPTCRTLDVVLDVIEVDVFLDVFIVFLMVVPCHGALYLDTEPGTVESRCWFRMFKGEERKIRRLNHQGPNRNFRPKTQQFSPLPLFVQDGWKVDQFWRKFGFVASRHKVAHPEQSHLSWQSPSF